MGCTQMGTVIWDRIFDPGGLRQGARSERESSTIHSSTKSMESVCISTSQGGREARARPIRDDPKTERRRTLSSISSIFFNLFSKLST